MTAQMGAKLVSVSRTVGLTTRTSVKELFSRSIAISKCIRPMPPKSQKQTFWTAFKAASYETTDDESDEEAERESTTSSAEEQKEISRGMHD